MSHFGPKTKAVLSGKIFGPLPPGVLICVHFVRGWRGLVANSAFLVENILVPKLSGPAYAFIKLILTISPKVNILANKDKLILVNKYNNT